MVDGAKGFRTPFNWGGLVHRQFVIHFHSAGLLPFREGFRSRAFYVTFPKLDIRLVPGSKPSILGNFCQSAKCSNLNFKLPREPPGCRAPSGAFQTLHFLGQGDLKTRFILRGMEYHNSYHIKGSALLYSSSLRVLYYNPRMKSKIPPYRGQGIM